jgi:DNA mismatch repair protein MutS2
MNDKYFRTLEFDKILNRLAAHTAFSASEELARSLSPSKKAEEITARQGETTEALQLLDQHSEMGIGGARDLRPLTRNARIGAVLTPLDLLEVRQTLTAARALRRSITRLQALYPRLAARAALLEELPAVVDAVARAINDRAEVADTASDELARIRGELNVVRGRLMDRLQRILTAPSNAKLIQEPIITERDGRYVIPLRAEAKGRLPGVVHDTSASGATLFIEPLAVVEMGNRVRELEREEEREVERILRELTALVGSYADPIDQTVETLAELDLAFAKAKYSDEIRGIEPKIEAHGAKLDLKQARHPLLEPRQVVPISVWVGEEFSILIITGPNTGGKTVTLKTVGLLALMAQSGLHIPAEEGSRLPVYNGIFADIGDEQSIEQSLSTFSSHLKNIVDILRQADEHSLVLLDELGAGTDPVEGSALARAILASLLERKIPALVATHYAELKAFAHSTPGVQNASMEFDVETLSPTFHLTIGLPGRSNAFAIAGRLGLSPEVIEDARAALTRGDVEMETMLAQIRQARQEAASARAHAELAQREAEHSAVEARRKIADAEKRHDEILEQARQDAQAEIELAREELERLRQEWRAVSLTREFVENEEAKLDELAAQLPAAPARPGAPPAHVTTVPGEIHVGDTVWVARLGQAGEVVALDDNGAEVQVGSFRVRVKANELERVTEREKPRVEEKSRVTVPEVESPGVEVSLRGLRADDALDKLEKYIDRAYMAGLPYVRIVHGKGTGTLRKLARDLLREHPLVAEIREAEPHEGGEGVTIAALVRRW